jgi:hypothetical protein
VDYHAFEEKFGNNQGSELQTFEKFYAVRYLIEQGCSRLFVNTSLIEPNKKGDRQPVLSVDVCGECNDDIVVVFCETSQPTDELFEKLNKVVAVENVRTVMLYPFKVDAVALTRFFSEQFDSGQFTIEAVHWLDDDSEDVFETALDLVTLLGNRTRMSMLLPLLKEPRKKSHFRLSVNPKLVYENISMLMSHRLVEEFNENEYDLTPIGRQVMGEYLAFLHKVKKILEIQG